MAEHPPRTLTEFVSSFVWTEKGGRIHITDDGRTTRCGWPVSDFAWADDVLYFGVCDKCRREGDE